MTEWRRTQESSHAVFSCSCVGKNSIFCTKCKKWIHHKCTHTQCYFKKNPNFVCKPCARHLPPSPIVQQHRQLSDIQLEQVAKFCYLGYIYDWSKWWLHGCSECQKKIWHLPGRKFMSCCQFSFTRCAYVYNSCALSVMLTLAWHAPWQRKCWPNCVKTIMPWHVGFVFNYNLTAYQW